MIGISIFASVWSDVPSDRRASCTYHKVVNLIKDLSIRRFPCHFVNIFMINHLTVDYHILQGGKIIIELGIHAVFSSNWSLPILAFRPPTYLLLTELSPSWEAAHCAVIQETPSNFKEPEGSSPCSQEASTGPYPEPVRSSPYHPIVSL
jgi:hypothetical protein